MRALELEISVVDLVHGNGLISLECFVKRNLEVYFSPVHHALLNRVPQTPQRLFLHACILSFLLKNYVVLLVTEVLQAKAVFCIQVLVRLANEVHALVVLPKVLESRIQDEVQRLLLHEVVR